MKIFAIVILVVLVIQNAKSIIRGLKTETGEAYLDLMGTVSANLFFEVMLVAIVALMS